MNGQLYKILQVPPSADISTIRRGYRRAALLAHPDKGGSEEMFHLVALAFETLSNSASRKTYDKAHGIRRNKRPGAHCNNHVSPMPKRLRRSFAVAQQTTSTTPHKLKRDVFAVPSSRKTRVMGRLRNVLQSFPASQRREAMLGMDHRVQRALLVYMQALKSEGPHLQKRQAVCNSRLPPSSSTNDSGITCAKVPTSGIQKRLIKSGVSGIHKIGPLYRASASVANLEMYARPRPCLAMAVDDHIVLAEIKEVLRLSTELDSNLKESVQDILLRCQKCLQDNKVCEAEMQLRAKVRVRAGNWMGPIRISSPAIELHEALTLRTKLLKAKRSSWQLFRSECISLFQRMPHSHKNQRIRTREAAEAIADRAWASAALRRHKSEVGQRRLLARAVRDVAAVLTMEERRAAKEKERTEAVEQRQVQAAQRVARYELRRWSRCRDATMDDIMRGPPIIRQAK